MIHPARPLLDGDEVDGRVLSAIVGQFRAHHGLRLRATLRRLPARARLALRTVALLLHRNHPALPGYLGSDTPAGIDGYRPPPETLSAARRLHPGYQESRYGRPQASLQSLFIMGSGGSLAQTRTSDVDLWVCCDRLLHPSLMPKLRQIDAWAATQGLTLHSFLVDPAQLATEGQLPGTRTPGLLLDEFYRTATLVAGRYPLWWLIPATDGDSYRHLAARLLEQRFVASDQVLDFGPVPPFPREELAHAAVTELNRALETPHKSLLKLMLVQAYAEAPGDPISSTTYKQRIHTGERDPLRLDPYLLLHEHVEGHLRRHGRTDQLLLARRLLVRKTADNAAPASTRSPEHPHRRLLARFHDWGFSTAEIAHLRRPDSWSVSELMREHQALTGALADGLACAESLATARNQAARARRSPTAAGTPVDAPAVASGTQLTPLAWLNDMHLRRARFQLARLLATPDGAIAQLHPALRERGQAAARWPAATLHRSADGWLLSDGTEIVLRPPRLLGAVAWAQLNQIRLLTSADLVHLQPRIAQIRQGLSDTGAGIRAFVNAEVQAPRQLARATGVAESDRILLSQRRDPLDYSGLHLLHLESIDLLRQTADGCWQLTSFSGAGGLIEALELLSREDPAETTWHVIGGRERFAFAQRLETLQREAHLVLGTPGATFVLPFGSSALTLHNDGLRVVGRRHDDPGELHLHLSGLSQAAVRFDSHSSRFAQPDPGATPAAGA
ncbi:MAG: class I adenylate cyclase [Pseudomonadales bacterium]